MGNTLMSINVHENEICCVVVAYYQPNANCCFGPEAAILAGLVDFRPSAFAVGRSSFN
jgi:hypothetical protein